MSAPDLPHEAYLAALAALDGVGHRRLQWMLEHGSPAAVLQRTREGTLRSAPSPLRITDELRSSWRRQATSIDPARLWQRCTELGVGVLSLGAAGYPPRLASDLAPPVVLFHRGDPDVLCRTTVGIVGTRRPTGYGRRVAAELGEALADAGVAVVSGLALGIDAAAHRGALASASDAAPVGVVAAGLDRPCPVRNRPTADSVAERGVVFSEVPPGVPASPWRFPVRNRVIAALCDALVVVESSPSGGSMHTVREALDRDVPIFAVPGPIDSPASAGTNLLVRDGAQLLLGVDDVLTTLGMIRPRNAAEEASAPDPRPTPRGDAVVVLDEIGWTPVSVAHLTEATLLEPRALSSALTQLEDSGWVRRHDGWIERVARPGRTT